MTLVSEHIGQLFCEGRRIEYTCYGGGHASGRTSGPRFEERWVVLVPAHLMPRRSREPLARTLAAAGFQVVTLDLLGHGRSDRPEDPLLYSNRAFAEQVLALLDHLGADRAVLGGTARGANVVLEAAVLAPERVQGLLLEAPVLENAVTATLLSSTPLLLAARFAPGAVAGVRAAARGLARVLPRAAVPFWVGVGLEALDQRPRALRAMLHGLSFAATGPAAADRATLDVPALVVGHRGDPLHPVADAELLAEELTASQYVGARAGWEWRARPARLDELTTDFVAQCFEAEQPGRLLGSSSGTFSGSFSGSTS